MKCYRCCFDVCFLDIISGDVEDMKALLLQLQQDNAKVSDEFFILCLLFCSGRKYASLLHREEMG